jgi:hypothetical protein
MGFALRRRLPPPGALLRLDDRAAPPLKNRKIEEKVKTNISVLPKVEELRYKIRTLK